MNENEKYSVIQNDSKKTIIDWLRLYTNEKNPWYDFLGLCFNDDLSGNNGNFNDLDAGDKSRIRGKTIEKMVKRVNKLFGIKFNKHEDKISKELFEIFISIYTDVSRSVMGVDSVKTTNGFDSLSKGKLEVLLPETRDKIVQHSKKSDEILNLIKKYSHKYNEVENFGYEISVEQYLNLKNTGFPLSAEQYAKTLSNDSLADFEQYMERMKAIDPVETRITYNFNNFCANYRLMSEVQNKISDISKRKMIELTGIPCDNATPSDVLEAYRKGKKELNEKEMLEKLSIHYSDLIKKVVEAEKLLKKFEYSICKASNNLDEFLSGLDDYYSEIYQNIAYGIMIERAIDETGKNREEYLRTIDDRTVFIDNDKLTDK